MMQQQSLLHFSVANRIGSVADNLLIALIRVNTGHQNERDTTALNAGMSFLDKLIEEGESIPDLWSSRTTLAHDPRFREVVQKCVDAYTRWNTEDDIDVFSQLPNLKEALGAVQAGEYTPEQLKLLEGFFTLIADVTLLYARSLTHKTCQ